MKKVHKYLLIFTSVVSISSLIVIAMLALGIDIHIAGKAIIDKKEYEDFKQIKEVIDFYENIDREYYKDIDRKLVAEGAIRGMFAILPDGYSRYFSKEELDSKKLRDKGESIGIGIKIQRNKNKEFIIVDVIEGRPAEKAGLLVGDKILSVNDIELNDQTYEDVIFSLKNQSKEYLLFGKYVQAKIIISRDGKKLEFLVDRDLFVEKSVNYEILDKIGYIKIERFIETTYEDYANALNVLNEKNINHIILDLRGNPGGLVNEATKVAGSIIGKNKVVYFTNSKNEELREHRSSIDKKRGLEIVVLVDEKSASSSEILVGAIQDHRAAKIVGTTTFGKGIIQTTYSRLNGDGYQITTSEYLTPDKKEIHNKGIKPDIELQPNEDGLQIAKELLSKNDGS